MRKYKIFIMIISLVLIGLNYNKIDAKYLEGNNVMNFVNSDQFRWKVDKVESLDNYEGEWKKAKGKILSLDGVLDIKLRGDVKISKKEINELFKRDLDFFIPTTSSYEPEDKAHNLQIIYRPIYKQYKINQSIWMGSGLAKYKTGQEVIGYVNIFSYWECSYQYIN